MLRIEEVTYAYKDNVKDALKSVSATFEDGKLSAIVGPSGSGKSTLLSILAGLDRPKSGAVYVDADSLAQLDLDKYRRERVSMIFQAFQLFPLLTAIENVCYPMELLGSSRKDAEARAATLLESVGIVAEKHKRYPSNLSGGEQQRVAIARALSSGARVILADEPTGNLDGENSDAVIEILRCLVHDDGYCVIIVTHDLEIAENPMWCTRCRTDDWCRVRGALAKKGAMQDCVVRTIGARSKRTSNDTGRLLVLLELQVEIDVLHKPLSATCSFGYAETTIIEYEKSTNGRKSDFVGFSQNKKPPMAVFCFGGDTRI